MEITRVESVGIVHIIEASYYDGECEQIRGAQWNGRYYVLHEKYGKLDLAGILEGNAYRWRNTEKGAALQAHWHSGGGNSENDWISYPWDGQCFGAIAPSLRTFCQ